VRPSLPAIVPVETGEGILVRSAHILIAASMLVSTAAGAADYRTERHRSHARSPRVAYAAQPIMGIRQMPPLYYVNAPPHYVQDLRFGGPGYWVQNQPSLLDRLFGPRDYY
jgi:hypothetical protein